MHNDSHTPPHITRLNPEQLQAATHTDGPLLVLAGAGTGKTRVLTARIAQLMLTGKAMPGQILAVTFTNKAAKEMTKRVAEMVTYPVESLWLGTFHSVAARILRRHAELVGLTSSFSILDMDDQFRLLKTLSAEVGIDEKKYPAKIVSGILQRWKDQGLTPEKVPADEARETLYGKAIQLYKRYQARLQSLNSVDFGDLLLHNLTIFTTHTDILAEYQRRFRYILVDEYQDTNISQYLWLRLLAQAHKNICCVGDDDQSIYGWRGAEIGNILKFEHDFPNAMIVRLEQNYRSTTHILSAAAGLIAQNKERLGKTLWTETDGGEKVRVVAVWDDREEARYIAGEIEMLQRKGFIPNEIAVLVRAGFQTRAFEESFITAGIPYRVIGGLRFYERLEIRDVIAYLRVTVQHEDDLAFERIINTPRRSIGEATLQQIRDYARDAGISLFSAVRALLEGDALRGKAKTALDTLLAAFDRWQEMLDHNGHVEVVEAILQESGYLAMWQNDKSPEAEGRVENIKELLRALGEFQTITDFLEYVSLVTENDNNGDENMVSIMTLHAAKGLEFDGVFLPGWEEGLFPHQRSMDEKGQAGLEEERRLAYVGITRAKKRLMISYAASRRVYGQWQSSISSRFIDELPNEHTEMVNLSTGSGSYNYRSLNSAEIDLSGYITPTSPTTTASLVPKAAAPKAKAAKNDALLNAGDRVFHDKFGYGYIRSVSGSHLEVMFDKAGAKKVIDSFIKKFG